MSDVLAVSYEDVQTVTPSDSALVPGNICAGFMVTVAGNISITTASGTHVTIPVSANLMYTIAVTKVWATSTTATGIYAIYANPYTARPSV